MFNNPPTVEPAGELVFVYNAGSSMFARVSDLVRKIAAPQTYECNLCRLSHGSFRMKAEWKDFLSALPQKKIFLHREEFRLRHPDLGALKLPAILLQKAGKIALLASAQEIDRLREAGELMDLLQRKLNRTCAPPSLGRAEPDP